MTVSKAADRSSRMRNDDLELESITTKQRFLVKNVGGFRYKARGDEFFAQPYLFEQEFTDQELSWHYVICSTTLSGTHLLERPKHFFFTCNFFGGDLLCNLYYSFWTMMM